MPGPALAASVPAIIAAVGAMGAGTAVAIGEAKSAQANRKAQEIASLPARLRTPLTSDQMKTVGDLGNIFGQQPVFDLPYGLADPTNVLAMNQPPNFRQRVGNLQTNLNANQPQQGQGQYPGPTPFYKG